MFKRSASPPTYQDIRVPGQKMATKILNAAEPLGFNIVQAARRMTLPVTGRTLMFDGETDMYALFDFHMHEVRVAGKTMVEHSDPERLGFTPFEAEILRGMQQSRTALFQTGTGQAGRQQVELRDLLEPERPPVWLTDIGLSTSVQQLGAVVLFVRLVESHGVTMTSGFNFVFHPADADGLLQSFRQKMKKVAPADWNERKFVFFFQKHRQIGEQQAYLDVVPQASAH